MLDGDVSADCSLEMDTMLNVWSVVEHARVASGAAELAIFTAILYWFFTSRSVQFSLKPNQLPLLLVANSQ